MLLISSFPAFSSATGKHEGMVLQSRDSCKSVAFLNWWYYTHADTLYHSRTFCILDTMDDLCFLKIHSLRGKSCQNINNSSNLIINEEELTKTKSLQNMFQLLPLKSLFFLPFSFLNSDEINFVLQGLPFTICVLLIRDKLEIIM